MEIRKGGFDDAGEKDSEGRYSWHIAGFYYFFSENGEEFRARTYDHSLNEAYFAGYLQNGNSKYMGKYWDGEIPYENHLFVQSVRLLVENEGVQRINILVGDGTQPYVPVAVEKCLETG